MKRHLTLALLASLSLPGLAQHHGHGAPSSQDLKGHWIDEPLIQQIPDKADRSKARLRLDNLAAGFITAYPPEGAARELPLAGGPVDITSGPMGNYHWLQARVETPDEVRVASSFRYFGNPGPAPTAMLAQPKGELEIVPQPLPREHWQYRSNQEWAFLIRYQGQPLANATLHFMTRNGSHDATRSGPDGVARIYFPDDWPPEAAGDGSPRRAMSPFVLMVEHQGTSRRYHTAFNAQYGTDPMAERNLPAGMGFLALGGILALPLLRRKKTAAKPREECP